MTTATLFDLGPALAEAPGPGEGPGTGPAAADQWRLTEIQLANWGTFDREIHRLPIARRGHLITGPSGSGKSSLLDAIAAVLTPDKWLRFNVAALSAGARSDQRSIVSYVRGAWSRTTDDDEDRIVSRYLRPGATWSGIVLRYEAAGQKPVSLVRLFFVRGSGTTNADVSDLCMLDRSAVDLADVQEFARGGIEARRVKAAFPDAVITTNGTHGKFYARLRTVFGIAHESALQLLHKTQSAKSLDSLDQLFREHMLERPGTFELADTAVEQFGELKDAHDHVVQLRLQRDHLTQLREAADQYGQARTRAEHAKELAAAVRPYTQRRALDLARIERTHLVEKASGLAADVEQAEEAARSAEDDFDAAQRRSLAAGGADAEALQGRIRDARDAAQQTDDRWESLRRQLAQAGIEHAPATAAEFAELQTGIARTLEDSDGPAGPTHEENERYFAALRELRRIDEAIAELRRSGSTVPGPLQAVRREISEGTGLPTSALPFAAELIEVRREHAGWTGAIERVLRPLALTLLVRSEHIRAVRQWVETHRIRARLVFEEVAADPPDPRPVRSDLSLVHRVAVKEDRFGAWVRSALAERFDVACVDSPDALDDHSRAVTINGQLKSSRTRYEKDDRSRIDDRSTWVLGDREAKVEAYIALRTQAQEEYESAKRVVDTAAQSRDRAQRRSGVLAGIQEQSWAAV
ncbi:MAG TPA: ATP-binding protein, partial [Brevibacterium sp.]|nr:ATP-binding protein [Brevibacterium sp.]